MSYEILASRENVYQDDLLIYARFAWIWRKRGFI